MCETTGLFFIGDKDCARERIEPTKKHEVRWSTSKSIFDVVYALDDEEKTKKIRSTTEDGIEKMTYPSGAGALYNFYSFS